METKLNIDPHQAGGPDHAIVWPATLADTTYSHGPLGPYDKGAGCAAEGSTLQSHVSGVITQSRPRGDPIAVFRIGRELTYPCHLFFHF